MSTKWFSKAECGRALSDRGWKTEPDKHGHPPDSLILGFSDDLKIQCFLAALLEAQGKNNAVLTAIHIDLRKCTRELVKIRKAAESTKKGSQE